MTAGYSGTPLAKKLGIKEGFAILAVDAPDDYSSLVEPLPIGAEIRNVELHLLVKAKRGIDLIHFFTNSRDNLFRSLPLLQKLIKQDGSIWVSWYKKAAKLPTEITEDTIREACLPIGLVDVKVCAIDDRWSGLKLVIRKENRS
ncbi:MAG: DUF3052 domain-containing protein [Acidobacteria bacterium]|nr:MAG: DUF3052 domain-containing protein [Acidobacteriota bacterium]